MATATTDVDVSCHLVSGPVRSLGPESLRKVQKGLSVNCRIAYLDDALHCASVSIAGMQESCVGFQGARHYTAVNTTTWVVWFKCFCSSDPRHGRGHVHLKCSRCNWMFLIQMLWRVVCARTHILTCLLEEAAV